MFGGQGWGSGTRESRRGMTICGNFGSAVPVISFSFMPSQIDTIEDVVK